MLFRSTQCGVRNATAKNQADFRSGVTLAGRRRSASYRDPIGLARWIHAAEHDRQHGDTPKLFGENFFYIRYFQQPGVADAELERPLLTSRGRP